MQPAQIYQNLSTTAIANLNQDGLLDNHVYYVINLALTGLRLFISGTGMFNNVIVIIVFIKSGVNDSITILFLALASSDLASVIVLAIYSASVVMSDVEATYRIWHPVDPVSLWLVTSMLSGILYIMSTFTTSLLAVLRCLCVARPFQFKGGLSKKLTLVFLGLELVLALICYVPLFAAIKPISRANPVSNSTRILTSIDASKEVIDFVRIFVSAVFPTTAQIIIMFCLLVLITSLNRASKFRNTFSSQVKADSEKFDKMAPKHVQVVKQVTLISAVFALCNIVNIGHGISHLLVHEYERGRRYSNLHLLSIDIQLVLSAINASVNLYIYLNFNKSFRLIFLSLFCFKGE